MDLIYYRGLNCRLASLLNIADMLGANYLDAYVTLWSETDFSDEIKYNIYMSKRVYENLDAIGIRTEPLDCARDAVSHIADGTMLLIGADTIDIPWHPVFGHFHDPHYFFAKKQPAQSIVCFDPVYGETNTEIKAEAVLTSAFELCRVYRVDASPPTHGLAEEAAAILRHLPDTAEALSDRIQGCKNDGKRNLPLLLKQINAMLNNRYLFGHYARASAPLAACSDAFFNDAYYANWEAVRNGLYKSGVVKQNEAVIDEVCKLFARAMQEELSMAARIAEMDV